MTSHRAHSAPAAPCSITRRTPLETAVYDILGFGKPPEELPFAATPGVFTFGWGPVPHQLADGLGVRVDDIKETVERTPADNSFDTRPGTPPPEQSPV